jgi:hypothetical protein
MRALVVAVLAMTCCAMPASAQTLHVGPFELGMSPHEVDVFMPGTVRFELITSPTNGSVGHGTVRAFNAEFQMAAIFYWNTGLRSLSLEHTGEEDAVACAAIADAAQAQVEREFGATPKWNIGPLVHDEWRLMLTRGGSSTGPSWCTVTLHVSADPLPLPDPMVVDFALAEPIGGPPVWLAQPTHQDVQALHPERAAERGQGGVVSLGCRVRDEGGSLYCLVRNEAPQGWGFGAAAVRVSELYRIAPESGGAPTTGRKLELTVDFTDVPLRER